MSIRLQPVDLLTKGWEKPTRELDQIENGVLPVTDDLAIVLNALTTAQLNGSGVFDRMMQTTKKFLKKEYDANRIVGKEYSQAYMATVLSNMKSSIQFLLDQQQVHLLNSEIGLLRQQTVTELALTDDNIPQGLGFNFVPAERTTINPVSCCITPVVDFANTEVVTVGGTPFLKIAFINAVNVTEGTDLTLGFAPYTSHPSFGTVVHDVSYVAESSTSHELWFAFVSGAPTYDEIVFLSYDRASSDALLLGGTDADCVLVDFDQEITNNQDV